LTSIDFLTLSSGLRRRSAAKIVSIGVQMQKNHSDPVEPQIVAAPGSTIAERYRLTVVS
jgi:hypothetical protein